jgi:recombinase
MSLRRKRRRKREKRRHRDTDSRRRTTAAVATRAVDDAWRSPDWALGAGGELDGVHGIGLETSEDTRDLEQARPNAPSASRELQRAGEVRRLAYTRGQASEALGVSLSTIDRRVVPSIVTVKLPWGQRLIPVDELERFLRSHLAPARRRRARRPAGRRPTLPPSVVERIRLEYARGRGISEIARRLTDERVPTAHGGRKWWPSSVRAVLVRSSPAQQTATVD